MKRFSNLPRMALLGLAALLLLSCGLCMGILIMSPDTEPDERAEATAATTVAELAADVGDGPVAVPDDPTTAPTDAPPTALPTGLPTRTARPTVTPHPTATPNATATANARAAATAVAAAQGGLLAEMAYAEAIQEISFDYMEAMDGIAKQSEAASENPYLIANDEWIITTAVYLAALQVAGDDVRALDPPSRFAAAHADLLEAADYYDLVALYYSQGVDEMDAGKLELATINMQLGSEAIQRATIKLQALAEE